MEMIPSVPQDPMKNKSSFTLLAALIRKLTLQNCTEIWSLVDLAAVSQPEGANDTLLPQGEKRFQSLIIELKLIGFMDEIKINAVPLEPFENSPEAPAVCVGPLRSGAGRSPASTHLSIYWPALA